MRRKALLAATALALVASACGSSSKPVASASSGAATTKAPEAATTKAPEAATTKAPDAAATTAASTKPAATSEFTAGPSCGLGNGKKASGAPIKLGNVTTKVPGIDFSTGPAAMEAYFKCVNENGGINGRPVQMLEENDNLKPEDAAAAAKKLIETDKVVAVVGGFSIIDCPVNADYYVKQGYNVIVAGVPAQCFNSPAIAAFNMGPGYSALGAAQIMVEKGVKGNVVTMTNKTPTADYNNSLAAAYFKSKGITSSDVQLDLPITDPATPIRAAIEKAGKGGGVLLNFTPESALPLLKSAEEQGLMDNVIWGSSTPINDDSVAAALGSKWKEKININAELSQLQDPNAEMELYRTVSKKYIPEIPLQAFTQMGFGIGRIVVKTLMDMPADKLDDPKAVNAAIKGIKNFKTGIICKPWYFGGLPGGNVPNNTDNNAVPDGNGKMKFDKTCFAIAEVEPILTAVRAYEKANGWRPERRCALVVSRVVSVEPT
jgi:branched-chain amino acid transport system substrate-binding protein